MSGPGGLTGGIRPAAALLLALLREDEESARALIASSGPALSEALVAEAARHGLGGYLAGLWASPERASILTGALREGLASSRRRIAMDNTLLLARARPLLEALQARGIEPIVLKGTALLGRVYPDAGARLLSDLDLLVPAGRAGEIAGLLPGFGLMPDASDQRTARRRGYGPVGDAAFALDLHWDLSQRYRFQADLDGVWERSIADEFEGIRVRRLGREDEFLYLALHYASHYFGVTLKWLVDLRELLRSDPPDEGMLLERARAWGGAAALAATLRYVEKVYPGAALPAGPSGASGTGFLRRGLLARYLSDDPLELVRPMPRGPSRMILGLLLVDRPADMIRLGWVTLVGGDDQDHA